MTVTEMNAHDERISSFLDDAMPAAERAAFESELLDNAELRQQVIELRQLRQDVATLPRYSVTEGFAQRVVAAAVAAKANENANITLAAKPKTIRRAAIGGLAIAASVLIMAGSVVFFNNGSDPVDVATNNNGNPIQQPAELNPALAPVFAALPSEGEALVLRIRSPKNVSASKLLRDSLEEQGVGRRAPNDKTTGALALGSAYRSKVGNDRTLPTAADAIYLEISPAELELALERLAKPASEVVFVPEHKLAIAAPVAQPGAEGPNRPVAEHTIGEQPATAAPAGSGDFMQELSPRLFKLPQAGSEIGGSPTVVAAPGTTPKGKVRVLILIENVE